MTLNQKIAQLEKEEKERLELISMLLLEDLLGEDDLYQVGSYHLIISWVEAINLVNAEGIGHVDPVKLDPILSQALTDYKAEVYDLKDDPEGTQTRIDLTAWYVVWTTYDAAFIDAARAAGYTYIEWVTAKDENVCPVCLENEGVHPIDSAPTMPAHPECRCHWRIPTPNQDAKDALTHLHERYMTKIRAQTIHG